jgi:putative membrane protein
MWCFGEGTGWWSWFGGIGMFVIWGGFIGLIIWGIMRFTRRDNSTKQTSISFAEERYAKGEISKEELEQIKKDLR